MAINEAYVKINKVMIKGQYKLIVYGISTSKAFSDCSLYLFPSEYHSHTTHKNPIFNQVRKMQINKISGFRTVKLVYPALSDYYDKKKRQFWFKGKQLRLDPTTRVECDEEGKKKSFLF